MAAFFPLGVSISSPVVMNWPYSSKGFSSQRLWCILTYLSSKQIGCTLALSTGETFGYWIKVPDNELEKSPIVRKKNRWFYFPEEKNCNDFMLTARIYPLKYVVMDQRKVWTETKMSLCQKSYVAVFLNHFFLPI